MGKIALAKKEKEECFSLLHLLSQKNIDSPQVRDSFSRFPNGFFVNDSIDSESFFQTTIKEPSKKDKLSKFLTSLQIIKKLGTTSFEIAMPSSLFEKNEKISAFKLINDSLIIWTENFVYKIPSSEKALKRIDMTKENISIINNLNSELQNFFLLPKFTETSGVTLQYSTKCETLSLCKNEISDLDSFLYDYFIEVFQSAELQDSIHRGFQHGDLHFRNILKNKNNELFLTDLDLIKTNGFPFLDLMHFAVHFIRTAEQTSQHKPFELFLEEKSYLFDKLSEYKFSELAKIWLQYYNDKYISLYLQSRLEWLHFNKVVSDELTQLENIRQKYTL